MLWNNFHKLTIVSFGITKTTMNYKPSKITRCLITKKNFWTHLVIWKGTDNQFQAPFVFQDNLHRELIFFWIFHNLTKYFFPRVFWMHWLYFRLFTKIKLVLSGISFLCKFFEWFFPWKVFIYNILSVGYVSRSDLIYFTVY